MQNFYNLTYDNKKTYLVKLFLSVKEIYPIYGKIYKLLSTRNDLNEDVLNKIYDAVGSIASETDKLDLQSRDVAKATVKNAEIIEQNQVNKTLSDIEKSFI